MSSGYRQGQGPFGGDVRPGGDVLLLHEEFESGKPTGGTPIGPLGTPAARLQERWRDWNPGTDPETVIRWLDPIAQRFSLFGPPPEASEEAATCRWTGNVLRMPAFETYADPPDEEGVRVAWLSVFAGVSAGPGQMLLGAIGNDKVINYAGLVVSSGDLSLADEPFTAIGIQQDSDPGGSIIIGQPYRWKGRAFVGIWDDALSVPNDTQAIELASLGALFRLEMIMEYTPAAPEEDPELLTELVAFVSNDGGRGWTMIANSFLKGPTDVNAPVSIGFGASSTNDPGSSQIVGIDCTGGFDFLRIYKRPFTDLSLLINPDGGRNWP